MNENEMLVFRDILLERKEQILKNISEYRAEIGELRSSEASDEADLATITIDTTLEETLTKKQSRELEEIDYAFGKIADGSYGVCEMCEEDIGLDRLKVKPQARYCIVCREIVEKTA